MTVTIDRNDCVETVLLDRPERLNSLDSEDLAFLASYFRSLDMRREIRAVIIAGRGASFCSGLDLNAWEEILERGSFAEMTALQENASGIVRAMQAAPQPIIGLGKGHACGAGFALLLACDIRLGTLDLKMNIASVRIGLSGADMGMSYLLPRIGGSALAAELMLTGDFLSAERARAAGVLSIVCETATELDAAGRALAHRIAATPEPAVRLTKSALVSDSPSLSTAVALEDRQQLLLAASDEHKNAVRAFLARAR